VTVAVSVVVLTHNEALNIERCLRSVSGWCRDLHVVDSGSTDETIEIARRYTNLVHHHDYVDHASQWAWVFATVPLQTEWLLLLDADNEVSAALRGQIAHVMNHPQAGVNGYYSVHTHVFRGRQVRGLKRWWLRLVRLQETTVDNSELVDFRLIVRGKTGFLPGDIVEHNLKENEIDFWIDKHQKFSTRMAAEEVLRRTGYLSWAFKPRLFGNPDERMTWFKSRWYAAPLFVRPFLYFAYRYLVKKGFLDGSNGFVYHFLQAFWFRLLVDIKMAAIYDRISRAEYSLAELATEYGHTAGQSSPMDAFPTSLQVDVLGHS